VDFVALAKQLAPVPTVRIRSRAKDRTIYLARPDLGRKTNAADLPSSGDRYDIAFIIADGLSASAVEHHAVPLFKACMKRLGGFSVAPVILGEQARVAFGDEAAAAFGAEVAIVLIGERPGLSVPDSLGAYITFRPQSGRRDSERNCISNIHADGLSYEVAADKIVWIVREALRLQLTGVDLKENAEGAIEALPHQEA
jgi:ethanolamine ammonia-lyase small subunit